MAKRAERLALPPRGMTEADVAYHLGRSLTWFQQHKAELIEAGFPPKLPIIDLYDREAVDRWLDQQGDPNERARRAFTDVWQKAALGHG
jgi:hypothetical protein